MIKLLRVTLFFWRTYLVRTLLTKRMVLVVLGCLVPPALAWFILTVPRHNPWPIEAFLYPSFFLVLQLMVPLAAVIAGSAVVSEELEDRTITYLLTRPIPRASILLGRWLATLTILLALVAASVWGLGTVVEHKARSFVPAEPTTVEVPGHHGRPAHTRVENPRPPDALVDAIVDAKLPEGLLLAVITAALLGVTVYSALFAALSTFLKHPMIVGLAFAGAIEGFLANLPGVSQTWTVQYYLRSYLLSRHPELWKTISEVSMPKFDTAQGAVSTLAVILFVALLAGSITITRKQYVLSA